MHAQCPFAFSDVALYCSYTCEHVHALFAQDKKDKAREAMRDLLSVQEYRVTMCDRISTLNPKFRLGDIK